LRDNHKTTAGGCGLQSAALHQSAALGEEFDAARQPGLGMRGRHLRLPARRLLEVELLPGVPGSLHQGPDAGWCADFNEIGEWMAIAPAKEVKGMVSPQ
jgi:hypothetical protein